MKEDGHGPHHPTGRGRHAGRARADDARAIAVGTPAYYFGLGDLHREWNDLDAAEQHLTQGMDLVGGMLAVDADIVTLGYIALIQVQQARGDSSSALAILEQFASLARRRNFARSLSPTDTQRRCSCGWRRDSWPPRFAGRRRAGCTPTIWICPSRARPSSAENRHAARLFHLPFAREAEYLTFARVQIALQRDRAARQAHPDTVRLLDRLLARAEASGRLDSVIEILMVRALALDAQGELTEALSALERALNLAEPEGYVRTFVDAGAPLAALLRTELRGLRTESLLRGYIEQLLNAFDQSRASGPQSSVLSPQSSALVEPLTEREREVLRLIAAGKSNAQIAQALVVAISTVKAHVNHLFGKLAVTSRTQAIAHARELHLF